MSTPHLLAGRYLLKERLGAGGMGTVWSARDERLHRTVAVKQVVPPPELSAKERSLMRERTMREARAAARIASPSAVTVYDVVEEEDLPWIVMELLDARTLSDVLSEEGPFSPQRAALVGLRVAEALEAAHSKGVLHRDVKPGNVMLRPGGSAVLADFGIALLDGDPSVTTTGGVIGSPAYLAPERARGESASPASDLWSLGATLYTMVEGRPPFDHVNQFAVLAALTSEDPPRPAHAGPLEPLIVQLLSRDPAARPDVAEVRRELSRISRLSSAGVEVARSSAPGRSSTRVMPPVPPPRRAAPSTPVRTERTSRRRMLLLALGLLALLALGIWAAVFFNQDGTSPDAPASPSVEAPPPEDSGAPSGAAEPLPENSPNPPGGSGAPTEPEEPASDAVEEPSTVPVGFVRYGDPAGWSVAVPEGWDVSTNGPRVDFAGPDGELLRIDSTDTPAGDPVQDWQNQEDVVEDRLPNYDRISIEGVEYRGWRTADWEFTFGESTRVLNRGFVVSDSEAHALYYSAPESIFDLEVFDVAAETFTPSG